MIRKRWLALIGAVLGPLTCFGGARADEGIIIIHPGPSAGGVSPEELAAAVNASSAISRAAVRSAFIQTQQIDQDLTSLREIWEAEEGAPVAYLSDADGYVVRLAAAQSGVPLFSQVSSGAASSFASDLQALAEKRINVFATGFGVFGNNNGTGGGWQLRLQSARDDRRRRLSGERPLAARIFLRLQSSFQQRRWQRHRHKHLPVLGLWELPADPKELYPGQHRIRRRSDKLCRHWRWPRQAVFNREPAKRVGECGIRLPDWGRPAYALYHSAGLRDLVPEPCVSRGWP